MALRRLRNMLTKFDRIKSIVIAENICDACGYKGIVIILVPTHIRKEAQPRKICADCAYRLSFGKLPA